MRLYGWLLALAITALAVSAATPLSAASVLTCVVTPFPAVHVTDGPIPAPRMTDGPIPAPRMTDGPIPAPRMTDGPIPAPRAF